MPANPVTLRWWKPPHSFGALPGPAPSHTTTNATTPAASGGGSISPAKTTTGPPVAPQMAPGHVGPVVAAGTPLTSTPPGPTQAVVASRVQTSPSTSSPPPPNPPMSTASPPAPPPPQPVQQPMPATPYYADTGSGGFVDTSGGYVATPSTPTTSTDWTGTPATPNPGTAVPTAPAPQPPPQAPQPPNLLEELLTSVENLFSTIFGGGSRTSSMSAARMGPSHLSGSGGPFHQNAEGWEYRRNLEGSKSTLGESVYIVRRAR